MMTRRGLMIGTAGSWLVGSLGQLVAADPASAPSEGAAPDRLIALPGKKPLIKRTLRPPNFETPLADLRQDFTPNEAFFVRYHLAVIPQVDPKSWQLRVSGASATRPYALSLSDLHRDFEQVKIAAICQCSGNRRGLFVPRAPGVQWSNGAMGNAVWTGVRLREVMQRAGIREDAVEVIFDGADAPLLPATPDFVKSLPIDRALDESTMIAFGMNGRPLPHWNGAPARLIVPGWTGTYWVKHLTEIRIEPKPFDGFWMKSAYRVPTGAFPGRRFATQETVETTPITEILVNSLITSHLDGARLQRGRPAELSGKAWDNGSGIDGVQVSSDGGRTWQEATLKREFGRFAWREFHWRIDTSSAGTLQIAVRARSRNGSVQSEKLTRNPAGYNHNLIQAVRLEIV